MLFKRKLKMTKAPAVAPKRVLLTRPLDDAQPLAELLRSKGIECGFSPLLDIQYIDGPEIDLSTAQALLVTSANGVRAIAKRSFNRDIKVLAVGDASAQAARKAAYTDVQSASGDVDALADLVKATCQPEGGALVHVAGSVVAGDLASMLDGYEYRREVLYEAVTAESLSDETLNSLSNGAYDAVLFYSPRTSKQFSKLIIKAKAEMTLSKMSVYCLSKKVAVFTIGLAWNQVHIAETPDQDGMLALLGV